MKQIDMSLKTVVVSGNVVKGFAHYGPFSSEREALVWVIINLDKNENYALATLFPVIEEDYEGI